MRVARLVPAREKLRIRKEAIRAIASDAGVQNAKPRTLITLGNILPYRSTVCSGKPTALRPEGTPTTSAPNRSRPVASPPDVPPPTSKSLEAGPTFPTRAKTTSRASDPAIRLTKRFTTILEIRRLLGIASDTIRGPRLRDIVFIALDTECERPGRPPNTATLVEIGLSILDTRDLHTLPPGAHLRHWLAHASHHSLVLDDSRHAASRAQRSLFSDSTLLPRSAARTALLQLLHPQPVGRAPPVHPRPAHILIGQSLLHDIAQLRDPTTGLDLDLLAPAAPGRWRIDALLDTTHPARTLRNFRRGVPSARLGPMLRALGGDPEFFARGRGAAGMRGVHHAGNDAAYTLMAAGLLALRWEEVSRGKVGRKTAEEEAVWGLGLMDVAAAEDERPREGNVTERTAALAKDLGRMSTLWQLFRNVLLARS
nr:hypothetical protein CFP56_24230 [Quercus suber]